jgi:DnaK suppressor protein
VTPEQIEPNAIAGKKRAMPKKEDDFRTTIMKGLELKKQELLKTLDSLMKARREYEGQLTAGDFIEEADGAQREISAYSQFNLIERKNKELRRIDYLLSRAAEEQDFGLCEECGARIPKERLLLVPEATLCVACQRELEKSDSRTSTASQSTEFIPTRREESLDTTEAPEEEDEGLVEYSIDDLSDEDLDKDEAEVSPEKARRSKTPK